MKGFAIQFELVEPRLEILGLDIQSITAKYGVSDESPSHDMTEIIQDGGESKYVIFGIENLPLSLTSTSTINCIFAITVKKRNSGNVKTIEYPVNGIELLKKDADIIDFNTSGFLGHSLANAEFKDDFDFDKYLFPLVITIRWAHIIPDRPDHYLSKSDADGQYGQSCSLSADGNTALITGNTDNTSGVAFIWTRSSNGSWSL